MGIRNWRFKSQYQEEWMTILEETMVHEGL
jgi:hypothetical protein